MKKLESSLLNNAVTLEYNRFGKPANQVCVLLDYPPSEFIKIQNKDKKVFLIPIRKIENIKLLGIPEWQK